MISAGVNRRNQVKILIVNQILIHLTDLINEIISTSEEDVNMPNDMIKILYFWSSNNERKIKNLKRNL